MPIVVSADCLARTGTDSDNRFKRVFPVFIAAAEMCIHQCSDKSRHTDAFSPRLDPQKTVLLLFE